MILSEEGLRIAKSVLETKGLKQADVARSANVADATVSSFFNRNPINRDTFRHICEVLELEPDDVADLTDVLHKVVKNTRANERYRNGIYDLCSSIRVPNVSEPVQLNTIFTETILIQRSTFCTPTLLESRRAAVQLTGLEAVRQYSKVMLLGGLGFGKTTLLKHLALKYLDDEVQVELVPIFISIARYADVVEQQPLLDYITQQMVICGAVEADIYRLVKYGRLLILLDGLNEAPEPKISLIVNQLNDFIHKYRENRFVISCRTGTCRYRFNNFVDLEISGFSLDQMGKLSKKWFYSIESASSNDSFIEYLTTNSRVRELAENPLILTLLCTVYAQKYKPLNSYLNRSELYEEALALILEEWETYNRAIFSRGILSRNQLQNLLSRIAYSTFSKEQIVFSSHVFEAYFNEYINILPAHIQSAVLSNLSWEQVARTLEIQGLLTRERGRYSFAHPAFQEYLTAREIVTGAPQNNLAQLVEHIFDNRWREVFLMVSELLPQADQLIEFMNIRINTFISEDKETQRLLRWLDKKTREFEKSNANQRYSLSCLRATYLEQIFDQSFSCAFSLVQLENLPTDLRVDSYLNALLFLALEMSTYPERFLPDSRLSGLYFGLDRKIDPSFGHDAPFQFFFGQVTDRLQIYLRVTIKPEEALDKLKEAFKALVDLIQDNKLKKQVQLLHSSIPAQNPEAWGTWATQLRNIMIEHRDIGHTWLLKPEEYKRLKDYYNANLLLVDCLNSECSISPNVREHVLNNLLLPVCNSEEQKLQA